MRPIKYLKSFSEAIQSVQPRFISAYQFPDRLRGKPCVLPRFTGLPITPWTFFERIPSVDSLNRLISIRGTIIRTGSLKMQEFSKEWECTRCKSRQSTFVDDHQFGIIPKPIICNGHVDGSSCKNLKFNEIHSSESLHVDYQEVKIQELTSVLDIGAVPRSILVLLRHELVDQCRAGDDVIITGVLGCRIKPNLKTDHSRMDGELFLQATSIQSTLSTTDTLGTMEISSSSSDNVKEQYEQFWKDFVNDAVTGRSIIVNSFCPQMHGMFLVKLACLMTVIGGCEYTNNCDNNDTEGDSTSGARKSRKEGHLLLVGDPGKISCL